MNHQYKPDSMEIRFMRDAATGFASLAYLPATVAPIGFSPQGLPIGVQIVGPQYHDRTCIGFAGLLFGAGPDIEELRHEQVMEKLKDIERVQVAIHQQTVRIRLEIADLSRQIEQNHVRVMTRLRVIESKLDTTISKTRRS